MLKLLSVLLCLFAVCMHRWERDALDVLCIFPQRVLDVSPMYSSLQAMLLHWKLYITPLLLSLGSWFLSFMRTCFMVVLPLKCTWIPELPQMCLKLLAIPLVYGITTWPIVDLLTGQGSGCLVPWFLLSCIVFQLSASVDMEILSLLLLVLFCSGRILSLWSPWLLFSTLICTLVIAQGGYLHFPRAFLKCSNSFWRSSEVVQTVLALWVSVHMMLYLAERLWWLSHCKYWSVWVGLQYTEIDKYLSARGLTKP